MKLRLQKQLNKIVDGKRYWKYVVVIPMKVVKQKRLANRKYIEVCIK